MTEGKKFEIRTPEKKRFEVRKTLADISPIEEGSLTPRSREDVARLVEEPLVEACQIFFDKGIQTWMSSANKKDIAAGEVHIIIRFDDLTPDNKEIALREGAKFEYQGNEYVKLVMSVNDQTTIKDISDHMVGIADSFESQS